MRNVTRFDRNEFKWGPSTTKVFFSLLLLSVGQEGYTRKNWVVLLGVPKNQPLHRLDWIDETLSTNLLFVIDT